VICFNFVHEYNNLCNFGLFSTTNMEKDDYINSSPKVKSVTSPLNDSARQTAISDDQAYYNGPQQSGQQHSVQHYTYMYSHLNVV